MRIAALIIGLLVATANPATAQPLPAITSVQDSQSYSGAPNTHGWAFDAVEDVVVTAIGLLDVMQPGLLESHQVGLWNHCGRLVAQVTIPAGTEAALTGNFRYVQISPTLLRAGHKYVVGAKFETSSEAINHDLFIATATFTTDPRIANVEGRYAFEGFVFPAQVDNTEFQARRFGPGLLLDSPGNYQARQLAVAPTDCSSVAARIEALRLIIDGFNLVQGIERSLDAKLAAAESALAALNAGNRSDAAAHLEAFINAVEGQRGSQLTDAQADALIAEAMAILGAL
jgi:hypothetical protein